MARNRNGVLVVGSANVDLVVRVARLPAPGETILGRDFVMVPGGKGANQAVASAQLGSPSSFIGRIGNDAFGDFALANLRLKGVAVSGVIRDPEAPTGVATIGVSDDGQNAIIVAPGANGRVSAADIDLMASAFERAVMLVQLEIPAETVAHATSLAASRGVLVVLNPAPAVHLPDDLLSRVDVLTPNRGELAVLSGMPVETDAQLEKAAKVLLARGVRAVVVTDGSRGAVVASDDTIERVAGFRVNVVDTTGAGDAFNGALAVALAEGQSLLGAARFANATGALATTALGAQAGLPSRDAVDSLLQSNQ